MTRTLSRRFPWLLVLTLIPLLASAQQADDRAAKAKALDLKVIADAQKGT